MVQELEGQLDLDRIHFLGRIPTLFDQAAG